MNTYRYLSPAEYSSYLSSPEKSVINSIIEGSLLKGAVDISKWQQALESLRESWPSSHLVLAGVLGQTRWVLGDQLPSITVWQEHELTNGLDELFQRPIDLRNGPTIEIHFLQGEEFKILWRCHHSLMDYRGLSYFQQAVFHRLRGEAFITENSTLTCCDLYQTRGKHEYEASPRTAIPALGSAENFNTKNIWLKQTYRLKPSHLTAKLCLAVAKQALLYQQGTVRIGILIDLRRHLPKDTVSVANLTGMITINIYPYDNLKDIINKIHQALRTNAELIKVRGARLIKWLPARSYRTSKMKLFRNYHSSTFPLTAVITNLGFLNPDAFSYDEFSAQLIHSPVITAPNIPLFISAGLLKNGFGVVAGSNEALGGNQRLNRFLEDLSEQFQEFPTSTIKSTIIQ